MKEVSKLCHTPYKGTILFVENTIDGTMFGLDFHNQHKKSIYFRAEEIDPFRCGFVTIRNGEVQKLLDYNGNYLFDDSLLVTFVRPFYENLSLIDYADKKILINTNGDFIKEFNYDLGFEPFSEGVARIGKRIPNSESRVKFGFIDTKGELIIPFMFENDLEDDDQLVESENACCNGLIRVKNNNQYGFIDKQQNLVIPYKFSYAYNFNDGLASVQIDNKHGFINTEGEFLISPKYFFASNFKDGYSSVTLNLEQEHAVIDINENFVVGPTKLDITVKEKNLLFVLEKGTIGYLDFNLNEVTPIIFNYLTSFNQGIANFAIGNDYGFIDYQNNFLLKT